MTQTVVLYNDNKQNYARLLFREALEQHYKDTFNGARTQNSEKYTNFQITYGELSLDGLDQLIKELHDRNIKFQFFCDAGCGKGRAVLYMSAFDYIKKSLGVEIVSERVQFANNVMAKMDNEYKHLLSSVDIREGDFTQFDYSDFMDDNGFIFIWISNLCFSKEINAKILNKIQQSFGNNYVICCSKELEHDGTLNNIFVIPTPMSWDKTSKVYGYLPISVQL